MLEQLMEMLVALGEDAYYSDMDEVLEEGYLSITFDDFVGFDDDYEEVYRDYDHPELVDELVDWLEEHCESCEGDLYRDYYFDGLQVCVGYSSFDI